MAHTFKVLHTLRSSEWRTLAANRSTGGGLAGDEPRPACAVQAHGDPGLPGDGTELGDGLTGSASDRQTKAGDR